MVSGALLIFIWTVTYFSIIVAWQRNLSPAEIKIKIQGYRLSNIVTEFVAISRASAAALPASGML